MHFTSSIKYELASDKDFEEKVFNQTTLTILIFSADWSGTAHILLNTVSKIITEFDSPIKFYNIDTEAAPLQTASWNIRSIPTTFLLYRGEVMDRFTGMLSKNKIRTRIATILNQS